jgi:tRNA 2-selenouridine synthase
MTWREIEADKLDSLRKPIVIDVRSPGEFAAERIPGAINIPLLDDAERATIGTVYAVEGEVVARRRALAVISPKIPSIVDNIVALKTRDSALVVHCWRGGLRSEAVVSFLTIVGIDCWRLRGGYKAWRRMVLDDFARMAQNFQFIVLQGRTGSGKTDLLAALRERGQPVLDLEDLSNHRGSIFGALGLDEQPTQKNFEGLLWSQLKDLKEGCLFVEAESRKVGSIALPDFILEGIQHGRKILVFGSLSARVERIAASYAGNMSAELVQEVADLISAPAMIARLGKEKSFQLAALVRKQDVEAAVSMLLQDYYDPLYDRHISKCEPFDCTVCSDSIEDAVEEIIAYKVESENNSKRTKSLI